MFQMNIWQISLRGNLGGHISDSDVRCNSLRQGNQILVIIAFDNGLSSDKSYLLLI